MSSSGLSVGPPLAQPHLLDDDGDRVRQLVAHAVEGGLADQLGDEDLLGCVGEVAVGIELRPLGQQPDEQVGQQLHLVARRRPRPARSPAHSVPVSRPSSAMSSRCCPIRSAVGEVGLGGDGDLRRTPDLGQLADDEPVARPDLLVRREAHRDHVDLGPGRPDQVVEPLAEQRARPVQAGGVDQDQLRVLAVDDAAHDRPRGLRLVGGDHDLLADQRVGQRGLAGVRPAHERREAAAVALGGV